MSAQLLDRATRPTPASILAAVEHLGYLQLDPTNVVARNHLLVLWSRFGRYKVADFDRLMWRDRSLYETITFILPTSDRALHELGIRRVRRGEHPYHARMNVWVKKNARLRRHVLARLRKDGPLPVTAFEDRSIHSWSSSGNDDRNVSQMLAFLVRLGEVTIGARTSGRRVFTLAKDWLPTVRPLAPSVAAGQATERALRAVGVGTLADLRRYYALNRYVTADALTHLVREGIARPVEIVGVPGSYFAISESRAVQRERTTLLSPFDPLIIDRTRTEALFGMRYRMEIYVPKHLRTRGYWAMPILHDDQLIGTVDPRLSREEKRLDVLSLRFEPRAPRDRVTRRAVEAAVEDLAAFAGAREVTWPKGIASSYSRR